uniref:Putative tubulin n=1 Tax=Helianthus annuus TaxID=4232 RepID=A0A251UNR9_HELAN
MLNLYAFVRKDASDSNNNEGKSDTSSELGEPINLKALSDSNNDEGKSDTSSELGEPINLKVMGISVSSVCISVHIGQAGIQVGNSRWKLYCLEHCHYFFVTVCSDFDQRKHGGFNTLIPLRRGKEGRQATKKGQEYAGDMWQHCLLFCPC